MSRRAVGLLAAAGLLLAGVATGPAGSASADQTIASAQAKAKALAAQVAILQTQVEVATERYDGVVEQLGEVVNSYIGAQQQLGSLDDQAQQERAQNVARIQALYKSGGQLGLLAQILDGGDISDVISRYVAVSHVLAADAAEMSTAAGHLGQATAAAQKLSDLADKRAALQSQAQLVQAQIVGLLQQREDQLATANATVRQLVAQAQAKAAAAAAAAAAATLNTTAFPPTVLPPGTPATIVEAITAARGELGDPYQWGSTGPTTWDCSGLTQFAYGHAGIALPRTSREQWYSGSHPDVTALLPGDLLFWATNPTDPSSIHHVAIYLGDGYMIEAPHTGAFVQIVPVYLDGYFGATRVVQSGTSTVITAGSGGQP